MAIDPNISLGVRPLEIANPLAQYGQIAAIQNAQNQNALAQFQLSSAQRQEEAQNALSESYKRSINPETGQLDPKLLISNVAQSKAAHMLPDIQAKLLETETKQATLKKTGVETSEKEFKLAQDKLKHGWMSMGEASTPQAAIEKLQDGVKQGYFDFATAQKEAQQLQNMTPDQYQQWRIKKVMGLLDAKDQLGAMLPKVARQEAGGKVVSIQDNPMLPGYGLPVAGMDITKTATIGEQTAQGQLGLAKQKFAWEQANPGYELKEDADGNFFGVNKRTLQASPVTIAGATPTAAPAAGAGMPGARVPIAPETVTPVAGAPGAQLVGKGQNLTESQGAAVAYGLRMKEANSILTPLEKVGVKGTGVISNTVGGVLGLTPLIGDKLENATGSMFNALPQILGGLSPEQQQVAQARINFITALLRKESGASISPSEFATAEKNYFPKPGDDAKVVAQKQKARELAIQTMEQQAGQGAKNIRQYQPSGVGGGVDTSNPLLR